MIVDVIGETLFEDDEHFFLAAGIYLEFMILAVMAALLLIQNLQSRSQPL